MYFIFWGGVRGGFDPQQTTLNRGGGENVPQDASGNPIPESVWLWDGPTHGSVPVKAAPGSPRMDVAMGVEVPPWGCGWDAAALPRCWYPQLGWLCGVSAGAHSASEVSVWNHSLSCISFHYFVFL